MPDVELRITRHTFDHLNIVWNKADVVLDFETGVPRISKHEITGAYMVGDKPFDRKEVYAPLTNLSRRQLVSHTLRGH